MLSQRDTRGTANSLCYHHISLLVVDRGGERVRRVMRTELLGSSGHFVNLRQVSCEARIPAGRVCTVFVSTYLPGEEGAFVLSVHSDQPVELTPLPLEV